MKPIQKIKARVTSESWPNDEVGSLIEIPKYLEKDFVKFGYGEIVKESPEKTVTPEAKVKRGRKPKTK